MEAFSTWVLGNGGDEEFIEKLKTQGFTSKLSLSNLNMDEDDCRELLDDLNFGQRCLLRGLVNTAKAETGDTDNSYSSGIRRSGDALSKAKNLRQTLGKLFNKPHKSINDREQPELSSDSDDVEAVDKSHFKTLCEILPTLPHSSIKQALMDHLTLSEAVDVLMAQQNAKADSVENFDHDEESSGSSCLGLGDISHETSSDTTACCPLDAFIRSHALKVLDPTEEFRLSVDRSTEETLWNTVLCFYKSAKANLSKLRRELVIDFSASGEVGADSGALRREFFEDSIHLANAQLFEGEKARRIVKKDWGMELLYEVAGMLVAHSILQGGIGIPFLSSSMFEYMSTEDADSCYPVLEDIPQNAATNDLITCIRKLTEASSNADISKVFDDPSSSCILNNCGWSLTEEITVINKIHLQQHLVHDEIILKRERNLKAFCHGLNHLGIHDLIKSNPDTMRSLFVYKLKPLTSDIFLSLISSLKPLDKDEARAFQFFKDFIVHLEDKKVPPNLPDLLRFITGTSVVPPLGLQYPIEIQYQLHSPNAKFPKSQSCFSIVMLPVIHEKQKDFFSFFLKALELCKDYGNI